MARSGRRGWARYGWARSGPVRLGKAVMASRGELGLVRACSGKSGQGSTEGPFFGAALFYWEEEVTRGAVREGDT